MIIKRVSWQDIEYIWKTFLWPDRVSAIEPTSAMVYLKGYNSMNMTSLPSFFGCFVDAKLVGVNSGHRCADNSYRSRGLWVDPLYRGNGYGKILLETTVRQAMEESSSFIWSFPRRTSWPTYKSVGFKKTSKWMQSETSDANSYCIILFD